MPGDLVAAAGGARTGLPRCEDGSTEPKVHGERGRVYRAESAPRTMGCSWSGVAAREQGVGRENSKSAGRESAGSTVTAGLDDAARGHASVAVVPQTDCTDTPGGEVRTSSSVIYDASDSSGQHEFTISTDVLDYFPSTEQSPAVACSSVNGRRPCQEDAHTVALPLLSTDGENINTFGVFDGHGGQRCSNFVGEHLFPAISQRVQSVMREDTACIEDALRSAFKAVDAAFLESVGDMGANVGSTGVVAMIKGRHLFCAWVGDSRAILCRADGEILQLSDDHKPSREDEAKRIQAAGGCVWHGRVQGVLGVSRAFGDHALKQWVPAEPDVVSVPLSQADDFLVLACDGLWDVADNEMVAELVRKHTEAAGLKGAACALTTFAIKNGSSDNVTCMIVRIEAGSGGAPVPSD